MLMNYHEMTMNESRDSPARRKQYLVICAVMASCFVYAAITSGVLINIQASEGTFPGGDFVYKYTTRDYAASMAIVRGVAEDAGVDNQLDVMYSLYLDDPNLMGGYRQRFASGILNPDGSTEKKLMALNKDMPDLPEEEEPYVAVEKLIPQLKYHSDTLPKAKAGVLNFPFTNGFVSALVLSHKVIPAMRKYAAQHGESGNFPVVLSTCSVKQQMCTHYAPLEKSSKFLMGKPDTATFLDSLPKEKSLDWGLIWKGTKKKFGRHLPSFLQPSQKTDGEL